MLNNTISKIEVDVNLTLIAVILNCFAKAVVFFAKLGKKYINILKKGIFQNVVSTI